MATKTMGEIISTLRKERGMTQKEVADLLGVTDKAVSKWERDVAFPDTATIPKLAEIFEVSVEELMNVKASRVSENSGHHIKCCAARNGRSSCRNLFSR